MTIFKTTCAALLIMTSVEATAQNAVQVGRGSYAAYPPLSVCKTDEHAGDQSRLMQYKKLYVREKEGQPIPTNEWWTNLITDTYSGHLWSYPQFIQAQSYGVDVQWPSYWIDNGTEMKSLSVLKVTGDDFHPASAIAESWHDWDVEFSMTDGDRQMYVTMAHGMPFTWFETSGFTPQLSAGSSAVLLDAKGSQLGSSFTASSFIVQIGTDLYGIYLPQNTDVSMVKGTVSLTMSGSAQYVVVALLKDTGQLADFEPYARNVPRDTRVSWKYTRGTVSTEWAVESENLNTGKTGGDVLQGFIPHHYRAGATPSFSFLGYEYRTPHGLLKLAAGRSFGIDYAFHGMLPCYAMPTDTGREANPFDRDRMTSMIQQYVTGNGFGSDTYWGGKSLTQMALNMMFAREMGEETLFNSCRTKLKEALVNWLTYTPGETNFFFARYDRWGGLVGYNTSYDSDTFNDHHFHYGYFTLAGALLALVDDDFRVNYGDMMKLLAKDYANWDRNDQSFPFFRTFDPWAGHSFAGGMGDSNGNGQESSSEAMQGWGGVYLLGVALGDDEMRDAGLFGWVSEARGTAEYWFDRHGETITDAFHTGLDESYNIDYSKFLDDNGVPHPYNSNLTCHGVGYWTYFGYNSLYMNGIQWMPISPALDYLSEDKDFVTWDYNVMFSNMANGGWLKEDKNDNGYLGDAGGWGNVTMAYYQRSNPSEVARIFDLLWKNNEPEARTVNTNGITYYVTHSHLSHGDLDWNSSASIPTARVYKKEDGSYTYMAYNPDAQDKTVDFYIGNTKTYTMTAKARQLTVSDMTSTASTDITPVQTTEQDPREELVMQNLALGKPVTASSYENAGTVEKNLTDGDQTTRWGSSHADGEWVTVDLGEQATLYKLRLHWEAAYASQYKVQLSNDGVTFTDALTIASGGGYDDIALGDAQARYIRILGVSRATSYGISLYELEAYGRLSSMTDDDLLGVKITSDGMLRQNEPSQLSILGYTCGGKWTEVSADWATADGEITADGTFTPSVYGTATVNATVGSIKASKEMPVEEAIRIKSLSLTADKTEIAAGETATLTIEGTDQFGVTTAVEGAQLTVSDGGTYDSETSTFTASTPGDYTLTLTKGDISTTLVISVKAFSELNLALGKPTTATSSENDGLTAAYATDGSMDTRWGSEWNGLSTEAANDQQITVDLKQVYTINKVRLYWQTARAATYELQVSKDGVAWQTIRTVTLDGSTDPLADEQSFSETDARYVRMQGLTRNLGYGYSIYEFQVYGTGVASSIQGVTDLGTLPSGTRIYTVGGTQVAHPVRGVNIINRKKVLVK